MMINLVGPGENETDQDTPVLYIDEDTEDSVLTYLHTKYADKALECYGGRTRNVLKLSENIVVKIPKNFSGCRDNDWEGSVSNTEESFNDPDYIQYPKTRLAYFRGIPVVFMEFAEWANVAKLKAEFGKVPDWTYSVDCGQVGFTRRGRLVAFDYGVC